MGAVGKNIICQETVFFPPTVSLENANSHLVIKLCLVEELG